MSHIRAGALALAGLSVVLAGSPAAPDRAGHPELAQAAPATEFARLAPLASVGGTRVRQGPRRPPRGALARRVQRLTSAAVHSQARRRPHFPVLGPFNWGQGGAQFGAGRGGRSHEGQDVFARTGTPLVAVMDGVVVQTGNDGGRGNYVGIYSPASERTYVYLHMESPARVRPGERVRGGARVGAVGCTGSCFGDHLHFEARQGRGVEGAPEDPEPALRRWAAAGSAPATLPPGQS